jgi:hypothetical protein
MNFSWEAEDFLSHGERSDESQIIYTPTDRIYLCMLQGILKRSLLRVFLRWRAQTKLHAVGTQYQKLRAFALKLAKEKKGHHSPSKNKTRPKVEIKTVKLQPNERQDVEEKPEVPVAQVTAVTTVQKENIPAESRIPVPRVATERFGSQHRGRMRSQSTGRGSAIEKHFENSAKEQERGREFAREELRETTNIINKESDKPKPKFEPKQIPKPEGRASARDENTPDKVADSNTKRFSSQPPRREAEREPKSLFNKLKEGLQTRVSVRPDGRRSRRDDVGTRLYNQAQEIEKKKELMRKSFEPEYPFTPQIAENTDKWLNGKSKENRPSLTQAEVAVVSSASILNFAKMNNQGTVRDFLSPKLDNFMQDFKPPSTRNKPFIPILRSHNKQDSLIEICDALNTDSSKNLSFKSISNFECSMDGDSFFEEKEVLVKRRDGAKSSVA